MSVKNLDMVAMLTREGKLIDEAIPVMQQHGFAVIKPVKDQAKVLISHTVKRDLTEIEHFDKEVPHLSFNEALDTIKAVAGAFRSIDAACASIICDAITSRAGSQDAAKDNKAWSTIKKEVEKELEGNGIAPATLPQQWANYWSKAKQAIALGFPVMSLIYKGKAGNDCCVARSALIKFASDNKPESDKLQAMSDQFENAAIRLDGGKDGTGEIYQGGDITVSQRAAAVLAEIGLSNLSEENRAEAVATLSLATIMGELIKQHGTDAILAEVATYQESRKAA